MVKTSSSNAGGVGLIPNWGAKIPCASQPKKQNIKQKQYCNNFNKDFKNGPHQKKSKKKKKISFFKARNYPGHSKMLVSKAIFISNPCLLCLPLLSMELITVCNYRFISLIILECLLPHSRI